MVLEEMSTEPYNPEKDRVPKPELVKQYQDAIKVDDCMAEYYRASEFSEKIQKEHKDYSQYQLYHWLIGSSPTYILSPIVEDFPGDCSINAYFQRYIDSQK